MKTHTLKTWPEPFQAVWDNFKTYEIRQDDRGFEIGDQLWLREYEPVSGTYSGREILVDVCYKTSGGSWGLPPGLCVLGLASWKQHVRLNLE